MRVLVTGCTGRVGSVLLHRVPPGMEAEILLGPADRTVPPLPWYRADITGRDRVIMAVTCASPDMVVHLAAMTDVDGCERDPAEAFRVNRDGAAHVAEACARCGAGMVYLSTDYIFDGCSGPYTESDEPNPVNVYGQSKLEGERACAGILDRLAVVRFSVPFGRRMPGSPHNFLSMIDERLAAGSPVRAVADQRTTPAWLDELAELIWLVARDDVRGIIHYGTSDRLSRCEMALALCGVRGYDESLVEPVRTAEMGLIAKRPLESGFVTGRAAALLGRPPVTFRDALEAMAVREWGPRACGHARGKNEETA
jgi:dTDP-4-dehydrorhamnose reductase